MLPPHRASPPAPGTRSRPSEPPSIVTTSCPAQASPPSTATNSATTAPARGPRVRHRARTAPAPRSDRRKKKESSSAPTSPTPSGVIRQRGVRLGPVQPERRHIARRR